MAHDHHIDQAYKDEMARIEREQAVELAESRQDYYVSLPGQSRPDGPLSESVMRLLVDAALAAGRKPVVLKVVEDYGK